MPPMEQDIPYSFQQFLPIIAGICLQQCSHIAAAGMSYQVNVNML